MEWRAAPSFGVRGSTSLSYRILDGSGSAATGRKRLACLAALILSGRGRQRPVSAGEPWLEQGEGLQQVRGAEWDRMGQPPGAILEPGWEGTVL